MVNDRHERDRKSLPQAAVLEKQRGVHQLILQQEVALPGAQPGADPPVEVVRHAPPVRLPGQGNHLHLITRLPQAFDEHPVVEEAAGGKLEAAVDDEANPQGSRFGSTRLRFAWSHSYPAHAEGLSQSRTAHWMAAGSDEESRSQRIRTKRSRDGFSSLNSGRSLRIAPP